MLKLVDIHTYYGASYILQGISAEARDGSVVTLLGRNGAGKTTTIRSIVGFTPPNRGSILFNGKEITHLPSYQIAQMGIGLVPQGRRIFSSLSVVENLTMSAREAGEPKAWSLDRIYSFFPILKERAKLKGNLLSGGEQQMLAIGRALMTNPKLLLMDEPSEGLAPLIIRGLGKIIKELQITYLSILLIEQNFRLALSVANYAYILSKGIIVYESPSHDLRNNKDVLGKYLGVAV